MLAASAREAQKYLDEAHENAIQLLLDQQHKAAELLINDLAEAEVAHQATVDAAANLPTAEKTASMAAHALDAAGLLERQESAARLLLDAQMQTAALLHDAVERASADILMKGQKEAAAILLSARMRIEDLRSANDS